MPERGRVVVEVTIGNPGSRKDRYYFRVLWKCPGQDDVLLNEYYRGNVSNTTLHLVREIPAFQRQFLEGMLPEDQGQEEPPDQVGEEVYDAENVTFSRGRRRRGRPDGFWTINQQAEYDVLAEKIYAGHHVVLTLYDGPMGVDGPPHVGSKLWELDLSGLLGRLEKMGSGPNGYYRIFPQELIRKGLGEYVKYVGPEDY